MFLDPGQFSQKAKIRMDNLIRWPVPFFLQVVFLSSRCLATAILLNSWSMRLFSQKIWPTPLGKHVQLLGQLLTVCACGGEGGLNVVLSDLSQSLLARRVTLMVFFAFLPQNFINVAGGMWITIFQSECNTLIGGEGAQTLTAKIKFELFALRGSYPSTCTIMLLGSKQAT